jgi:16S rRNA (cytidine1402-2'-O)-methyltransferase
LATLYVVATPIGNLGDLSPRAVEVLEQAPLVAAEGVGRAKKLLSHLGLAGKRVISCREDNLSRAAAQVREALDQGRDVALITDAGTPGVSDPGGRLVAELAHSGHRFCPVAGPSALTAAVSVAGWPGAPFSFLGFLPAKPGPRRRLLEQAAAAGWPFALFEAPHRLAATAAELGRLLGERPVVLARELSKLHEEVVHTTCAELAQAVNTEGVRGEITILVAGGEPAPSQGPDVDGLLRAGLARAELSPSKLARQVATEARRPRDEVYRRLLELKREQTPAPGEGPEMGPERSGDMAPDDLIQRELPVENGLGIHARAAARIAETLQGYECQVRLAKGDNEADATSVLSILTLDAPRGSTLWAKAWGPQAAEALEALENLFSDRFGEDS